MQKEIKPVWVWVAVAVVAAVALGVGYRIISGSSFRPQATGSEERIKRVQEGQPLYQPPANAPVPGAGGRRPSGGQGGPPMGYPGMPTGPPPGR